MPVGQKKELSIPPIWGCWGPTGDSFFTHEQIKHPPFFEGRWYTGKIICQIWAEWAVCLDSYLWKGWMFYLSMGKKLTSSWSTMTPDRWYQKFFFFGRLALPMMCAKRLKIFSKWSLNMMKVQQTQIVFNNISIISSKFFFLALHICQRQSLSKFFLKIHRVSKVRFMRFYYLKTDFIRILLIKPHKSNFWYPMYYELKLR